MFNDKFTFKNTNFTPTWKLVNNKLYFCKRKFVSQFKNIELNERSINLAESKCQGMLNGKKANHEMKIKIQKFIDQTNKLAQQFNKVAGKKCLEDSLDAERFGD